MAGGSSEMRDRDEAIAKSIEAGSEVIADAMRDAARLVAEALVRNAAEAARRENARG